MVVTTLIVWIVRDQEALTEHLKSNIAIVIAGGVCSWVLILLWYVIAEPSMQYLAITGEANRDTSEKRMAAISQQAAERQRDEIATQLKECNKGVNGLKRPLSKSTETNSPPSQVPAPIVAHVRIASQKTIPSTNPKFPYLLEVVIQTDTIIDPVAFSVECSGEVGSGVAVPVNGGIMGDWIAGALQTPNSFMFEWSSHPFVPTEPIKITISSKKYVRVTKIEQSTFVTPP